MPSVEDAPLLTATHKSAASGETPTSVSGTYTYPAMIAMREGLRAEAGEIVRVMILADAVETGRWGRDVIEVGANFQPSLLVFLCSLHSDASTRECSTRSNKVATDHYCFFTRLLTR